MDAKSISKVAPILVIVMVGLNLAGCAHKSPLSANPGAGPGQVTGESGVQLEYLGGNGGLGEQYGLQTVFFDYDSAVISPDAMASLKSTAEKIRRVPKVAVQCAGHCDSRGTQEYNLALGERRALAVRTFLIQCGVSGDRLSTISYGAEFPAVSGNDESAWSKNRRVDFNPLK